MTSFDLRTRAAGVLLHVTSLPGPHGSGDLGPAAHAFVDWLATAGQRFWQMLPVNPVGAGFSPYSTVSSFAGEPMLISLEALRADGLLKRREIEADAAGDVRRVRFPKARRYRQERLRLAFDRWREDAAARAFRDAERGWLDDYALFQALAGRLGTTDFAAWPEALAARDPKVLAAAREELASEIEYLVFEQYQLHKQWTALRAHAHARGVGLIGDLPIFVAAQSADVWAHRRNFFLDAAGRPTVVAGCPPDAFNADGQLWGNALYDWDAMADQGFDWWLARFTRIFAQFDAVRLDHFIGFHRYWEIPAKAKNARGGVWRQARGDELFAAVRARLGDAPFIAEDLGAVTPEVRALRDKYGFPGMKVLQFAFDGSDEAGHHMPHRLTTAAAVYTGTHDNHTTRGWYEDLAARASGKGKGAKSARTELARVDAYLGYAGKRSRGGNVHWDLLRAGYQSQASVCVVPVQDLLGQDDRSRMNIPGVAAGNWGYRVPPEALDKGLAATLRATADAYDRCSWSSS